MKTSQRLFALLLIPLFFHTGAMAALKSTSKAQTTDPAVISNPNVDQKDIELPMPGGYKMVFRAVSVPSQGILDDKKFSMGIKDVSGVRSAYEKSKESFIGAPFREKDLPKNWQAIVSTGEKGDFAYYFLGKYEISNGQWQAVMGGEKGERPDLPKTNISWYDIQQFLAKYNKWLLKNHPESLPFIEGMPGFLRLPTEEEWEFAARGGNRPPEKMEFEEFPIEGDHTIEDYAIFGSQFTEPMPIGKKLPNLLGLYDIAGNVAEMVQSDFRFTVFEPTSKGFKRRYHGSPGGLVSKGGSFIATSENDVLPGKRTELKMFVKDEKGGFRPFSSRSVGARLAIGSINVPGSQLQNELTKEVEKIEQIKIVDTAEGAKEEARKEEVKQKKPPKTKELPKPKQPQEKPQTGDSKKLNEDPSTKSKKEGSAIPEKIVRLNTEGDLVGEFDKLIQSTNSPILKSNLYQLRDMIVGTNMAIQKERDLNFTNNLRSSLYKADSLRNYAFRLWTSMNVVETAVAHVSKKRQKELKEGMRKIFDKLLSSTNIYILSIKDIENHPIEGIMQKLRTLQQEYNGKDATSRAMQENLQVMEKHIKLVQKSGIDALTPFVVWKDIIKGEAYDSIMKAAQISGYKKKK